MKSSPCTNRKTTSKGAGKPVINPSQTSSQATSLKSKPSRELHHDVISHAPNVMTSSTASLDDFSRAYVSLIRYFKAVWPNKEGKKSFRNGKKTTRSEHRSPRALELQLKRQQERVCYDWHREASNGWRVHRTIDPYGHIDSDLDFSHQISSKDATFSSTTPLESFHSRPLQQAK